MTMVNKKFKCRDDHTVYTLGNLGADNHYTILWTNEMSEEETDTWRKDTVEQKFQEGQWYWIEGIERPILEERKVGKIRMDLFNEGFPNAVLEIAKVMTWANENKGYKDHDWKQLPNADKDIPAAASRHGIKQLIQKAKGIPAIERTDDESNIVHLAHQAFNILAELELVLTGKIK